MLIDDGAMLNLLDQRTELFLVHNNTSDYLRTKISSYSSTFLLPFLFLFTSKSYSKKRIADQQKSVHFNHRKRGSSPVTII